MPNKSTLLILCISLLLPHIAFAVDAESRARALYHELRCMVCGGQSLAESNAELAVGMRQMIMEKLEAGQTEEEIKAYLTDRYGDEILMRPPLRVGTAFIWFLPLFLILSGAVIIWRFKKGPRHA